MKELREKIRHLVNDLFQDVDNEAKIDTDTANAICELHTDKFEQLLLERDKEVINKIEEIGFDSENTTWDKNLIIGCREPNELGLWSYTEFKNRNELLKTLKKE